MHSCCVVSCSNFRGRGKELSFYRIPKVIECQCHQMKELSERQWVSSISCKDWRWSDGACLAKSVAVAVADAHVSWWEPEPLLLPILLDCLLATIAC